MSEPVPPSESTRCETPKGADSPFTFCPPSLRADDWVLLSAQTRQPDSAQLCRPLRASLNPDFDPFDFSLLPFTTILHSHQLFLVLDTPLTTSFQPRPPNCITMLFVGVFPRCSGFVIFMTSLHSQHDPTTYTRRQEPLPRVLRLRLSSLRQTKAGECVTLVISLVGSDVLLSYSAELRPLPSTPISTSPEYQKRLDSSV